MDDLEQEYQELMEFLKHVTFQGEDRVVDLLSRYRDALAESQREAKGYLAELDDTRVNARAKALEEAAKICEEYIDIHDVGTSVCESAAWEIRKLSGAKLHNDQELIELLDKAIRAHHPELDGKRAYAGEIYRTFLQLKGTSHE